MDGTKNEKSVVPLDQREEASEKAHRERQEAEEDCGLRKRETKIAPVIRLPGHAAHTPDARLWLRTFGADLGARDPVGRKR